MSAPKAVVRGSELFSAMRTSGPAARSAHAFSHFIKTDYYARFLVSSFLADVTQHIHSLRAGGVMLAHTFVTIGSDSIAFRKAIGILWTVPEAIACRAMVSSSVPSIIRSANSAPRLLSARGFPFRLVRKAAAWMSASPAVAHP